MILFSLLLSIMYTVIILLQFLYLFLVIAYYRLLLLASTLTKKLELSLQPSLLRSRDSSVGIATGYGLDDQGGQEFESR
jgi:hypothetical protein